MTIIASLLRAAELPDSPTARLDAELLLAAALGKSRSYLHTWPEKIVSSEDALTFSGYLQRRRSLVYDGNPPEEDDEDDLPPVAAPAPETPAAPASAAVAEPPASRASGN